MPSNFRANGMAASGSLTGNPWSPTAHANNSLCATRSGLADTETQQHELPSAKRVQNICPHSQQNDETKGLFDYGIKFIIFDAKIDIVEASEPGSGVPLNKRDA
jgi:hypothetical protein